MLELIFLSLMLMLQEVLDNLSKPKGVIKEAQDLMAETFGADRHIF